MANVRTPTTIVTIALTGQTEFDIPFDYLARKFVVVTLIGVDRKVLVLGTDYRFVTKTKISLSVTTPAAYDKIELRRVTSASERLVNYYDGSILRAADLNISQIQTIHIAEEARDSVTESFGINSDGSLDARGVKITNLASGTNPTDAVNVGQLQAYDSSSYNNAIRAETARIAAEAAAAGLQGPNAASGVGTSSGSNVQAELNVLNTNASRYLHVGQFGVVGDGVTDDTAALRIAAEASYTQNIDLYFGAGTYLLTGDIEFKRGVQLGGYVKFKATRSGDVVPTIRVFFSRRHAVSCLDFDHVIAAFRPMAGDFIMSFPSVQGCVFVNTYLELGQEKVTTNHAWVSNNTFVNRGSRSFSAVVVTNVNNYVVEHNTMQEYRIAVEVTPTRSYSATGGRLTNNSMQGCISGYVLNGTSKCRISNTLIEGGVYAGTTRDGSSQANAAVLAKFAFKTNIKGFSTGGMSDGIRLYGCHEVVIDSGCNLRAYTNFACVRASGCSSIKLKDSTLSTDATGYIGLFLPSSITAPTGAIGSLYKSEDLLIQGNIINCVTSAIKIEGTARADVLNNTFNAGAISAGTGLVWFAVGSTKCSYLGNKVTAISGEPLKNDIGNELDRQGNQQTVTIKPAGTKTVSALTTTQSDPALNGAKSYSLTFSVTDIKLIKADASNTKKKMTDWMAGKTATFAINGSAWNTTTGRLPDLIWNGSLFDDFDAENYWWAQSAMVIDHKGILSCRDFASAGSQNYPMNVGAQQLVENTWQSAFFRSPLVVDGTVYDPTITGLLSIEDWNQELSARTCIGQKQDGTFVVVVVDGQSGVSGCTMLQAAQKMLGLGCYNAFNLDGGGSSTLWYNGAIANNPSDAGGQRAIPHVLYV